jgi:ubiquitin-protein ligase
MSTVRDRRLRADHARLLDYVRLHPRVKLVATDGDPPERYQLDYQIRSLRMVHDDLVEVDNHLVEIILPGHYPRLPPQCRMLTPIFHPNIAPHAICVGDHWSAGEPLWSLVARIGEMIAFQSYNTKSPLNGEAARWVANNLERLPLDLVSLLVEEERESRSDDVPRESPPIAVPPAPPVDISPSAPQRRVVCPQCQASLKVPERPGGKRARCPRCQTIIPLSAL